jgi:hypothetical protein
MMDGEGCIFARLVVADTVILHICTLNTTSFNYLKYMYSPGSRKQDEKDSRRSNVFVRFDVMSKHGN